MIQYLLNNLFKTRQMKKTYLLTMMFGLMGAVVALAQTTVIGTVTDSDGEPLIGVNILEVGTNNGAATDFDGKYSINVTSADASLKFSYTGYSSQDVPIDGRNTIDVILAEGVAIDEVVVTALGISREKKSLTYSAQSVGTQTLKEARELNVLNSLSGKVAGISVTQSSEGVGGASKVLLRGNRSISGSSQPLYIVDGAVMAGDIRNIAPDDIVEMTVLKGANAAALYGSRAQNGAIIVTTKSGEGAAEGVTTSFGLTYQATAPIHLMEFQNEYGQGSGGVYSKASLTSWGPPLDGRQVDHWTVDPSSPNFGSTYAFEPQPDNITDFFQTGQSVAANVGVNIKGARSNNYFSYTYTDASGVIPGNNLNSHNLGFRVNADLTSKLKVDAKVNYIRQDFANILSQGEGYDNPVRYLYKTPRNIRTEDYANYQFTNEAGAIRQNYWLPHVNGGGNPYWVRNKALRPELEERVTGLVSLKYQITEDLSILARSALDRINQFQDFTRANDTYTTAKFGSYDKNFRYNYEWNTDALINYNNRFGSNITLDLNAGTNLRRAKFESLTAAASNFEIENLFALSNGNDPRPGEGYSLKEVQSLYAFASLGFFDGLYLEGSARNDWSSTLPAANRSYFYPSFGVTAVLSDLMNMPNYITFLKLRGSWAEVGNDTDPYRLARSASVSRGTVTLSNTLPNVDLRPESTQSTEFGLDAHFFNNLLRLDFTYYKTNTIDQLFNVSYPKESGVNSVFQNGGDIQNRGVEIAIGITPITKEDFTWDIDFNFAKNESEVLKLAEGLESLEQSADFIRVYQLIVGEPFGTTLSRGFVRDDQGRIIVNANGIPRTTPGRTVPIANFNPDWLGGISNSFHYKNWNMSFLIDIRQGGTVTSFSEAILAGDGVLDYTTAGREGGVVGKDFFPNETAVTEDGSTNTLTATAEEVWNAVGGRNAPAGEAFIRDASNIRVREFVLGYALPQWNARISFVARNLFFISNKANFFDPEITVGTGNSAEGREAFPLPTNRTLGLSLSIDF